MIPLQVLLGEGYYAETTSKKAAEILKRRGKALETQVDSLNAMMQDLKAEASFFHTTAFEAAVGSENFVIWVFSSVNCLCRFIVEMRFAK